MTSAALGAIGFAFEPTAAPGEQIGDPPNNSSNTDVSILAYGAVAATASATNQPTSSGGMRMHIYVYSNTATGTVTITGKDAAGNAVTETTPTIPITPVNPQSQETGRFDYVTKKVFFSINSSGITTTGLTGGFIKIGGIYAAKYMLPGTAKINAKYGEYSADEHRALGDRHTHKIQTVKDVDVELDMAMYPDSSLFIPFALVDKNTATPSTSPSSATVLLAATAVSGSPLSLTTQPATPGEYLILTVASSSAIGTIAIAGQNDLGQNVSETVVAGNFGAANGNGTYYSTNKYSAVNASGLTITGLTSGTLAVNGVYAWNRTFKPTVNPLTMSIEWFTGSESSTSPFFAMEEAEFEFDVSKEFTVKMKGVAQDKIAIGDRTPLLVNTSAIVAAAQPIDRPNAGWACSVSIDPITGSPGSTSFGDMLSGKIKISNALEGVHTLNNIQVFQQVSRSKWTITFDAKLIYNNVLQLEQFRQDTKQYIQLTFYARNVGANNLQAITFVIPFKYQKFDVTSTPSSKYPEVQISGIGEWDAGINSSYQINWSNSGQNPAYTS